MIFWWRGRTRKTAFTLSKVIILNSRCKNIQHLALSYLDIAAKKKSMTINPLAITSTKN